MKRKKTLIKGVMFVVISVLAISVSGVAFGTGYYKDRILPGVSVDGVSLGGLTLSQAEEVLRGSKIKDYSDSVKIKAGDKVLAQPTLLEIGVSPQIKSAISQAISFGHPQKNILWVRDFFIGIFGKDIPLRVLVYKPTFEKYLSEHINPLIGTPKSANWLVGSNGFQTMLRAVPGQKIDQEKLASALLALKKENNEKEIALVLVNTPPDVSDQDAEFLRNAVKEAVGRKYTFIAEGKSFELPVDVANSWIFLDKIGNDPAVTFSAIKIREYLQQNIVPEVKTEVKDAKFVMGNDGKVAEFVPPTDGVDLDLEKSIEKIRLAPQEGQSTIELVLNRVRPSTETTAEIDRFGIGTLLSTGETNFKGSPANRIHNIKTATARFNGLLIPPGETFAFNKNLGKVGKDTGYKPELVIKENVTTPEYGGGICQVSTTTFRAAVLAGMQIVERRNHAYPVAYYGAPGFDATVYPNQRTWQDGTDLKFVNDTPGHVLIQTQIEGTKLIFKFWGTSDGREVKIVGPSSYDRKPNGAVKARLVQQVYKQGEVVREDVILSAYKSPSLFPHVLAANAEKNVTVPPATPQATPIATSKPTVKSVVEKNKTSKTGATSVSSKP